MIQHRFNKTFLVYNIFLLFVIVVSLQIFSVSAGSQIQADIPLTDSVEIGEVSGMVKGAQVRASEISLDGDMELFFNKQFLNIHESLIQNTKSALTPQFEVDYKMELTPPREVQVRDIKDGLSVVLTWKEFDDPPDTIIIYRSDDSDDQGVIVAEIDGESKGYYDFDIAVREVFYYNLISSRGQETSVVAGPYKIGPIVDLLPPAPPRSAQVAIKEFGIEVTWMDPNNADLNYVNIYRSDIEDKLGQNIIQVAPGEEKYFDEDVIPNTEFFYFLTSEDISGNESIHVVGKDIKTGNNNPFTPLF